MARDNENQGSIDKVLDWVRHWIDVPSIIGIARIFAFMIWLVRDYISAIS